MSNLISVPAVLLFFFVIVSSAMAESTLSGYDWNGEASTLGEGELLRVAKDHSVPAYVRARADYSLTQYSSEAVWNHFGGKLQSGVSLEIRRTVDNLCLAFSDVEAWDLTGLLAPLLAKDDPHVRVRTARCLKTLSAPPARQLIRDYLATVENEWEREEVSR